MESNYTDEQLDAQLGTSSRQFSKFKTISLDNGIDIVGTDSTGNFIEKQYNSDTQETARVEFASGAEGFPGIILAAKAQVADKAKYPSWRTGEFDPSNKDEMIDIFPLQAGKFIKEANGDVKKVQMVYQDLKAAKSTPNPNGGVQSTYNYFIVLYVGVDGEVIKLKFKGSSRGNWFDYSKAVAQLGAKIYNVMTIFSTYIDKSTGKYAIKFDVDKDANGIPSEVDANDVREMRVAVANSFQAFKNKALAAPKQARQLSEGEAPFPSEPRKPDTSEIKDSEIVGGVVKDDKINLADMEEEKEVPFSGVL